VVREGTPPGMPGFQVVRRSAGMIVPAAMEAAERQPDPRDPLTNRSRARELGRICFL